MAKMNDRRYASTPLGIASGDGPSSALNFADSLKPDDIYTDNSAQVQTDSSTQQTQGHGTSVKYYFKPISLVTANPSRDAVVISKSMKTTLIPFMTYQKLLKQAVDKAQIPPGFQILNERRDPNSVTHAHSDNFLSTVCRRSVYVVLGKDDLANEAFMKFLLEVLKKKTIEYGKENFAAAQILGMKVLLTDGVTRNQLPVEFKHVPTISVGSNISHSQIIEFLEGRDTEIYNKVVNSVQEIDCGARQKINVKPVMHVTDMDPYMDRAYHAIIEVFEDAGSYPRQQLLQLHHIPNVRSMRDECNKQTRDVCVEINPNRLEDYVTFLRSFSCGEFTSMLHSNIKVNGSSYIGNVDVEIDEESTMQALKCMHPMFIQKHKHRVLELLRQEKVGELCDLIESEPLPQSEPEPSVPKLTTIAATKIYQTILGKKELSPYEYLRYLKKGGCPRDFLEQVRSWAGYNALHLAVKAERDDFLKMLFYANKWGKLRNDIVQPVNVRHDSTHYGYTPRRLAEALSYKSRGLNMLNKFEKFDRFIRHMPPINKACLYGQLDFVSALIETHPYLLEYKDENLAHCLFYACASGNAKLVEFLMIKGVPRNIKNRQGETPLHIAAMFGHLQVLEVLSKYNFEIRGRENKFGYCAIHYCAMHGDIDALKLYQKKGFPIDSKALTIAAKFRQKKAFDFIIQGEIKVNQGADKENRVALHYAVVNSDVDALKKLFEKKADVTLVDKYKKNALHLAAETGDVAVMDILLAEAKKKGRLNDLISAHDVFVGKDLMIVVRGKDRGRKAWHWVELKRLSSKAFRQAMATGQVDVVNYGNILISGFGSGPDSESKKNMDKRTDDIFNEQTPDLTPLHLAVLKDHPGIVRRLLENGAEVDVVDYKGATAMHFAAMNDNIECMQLLGDNGGSYTVKTTDGKTPFQIADENINSLAMNFLQANEPMQKAKEFVDTKLTVMSQNLDESALDAIRESGHDVRRIIIDALRDLTIDINKLLLDLGSGPVLEASQDE